MKVKKSAVFNIISFLTLVNFIAFLGDALLIDRSDWDFSNGGTEPNLFDYILKCTSFGITFVLFLLYPLELYLEDKNIKLTNYIRISNLAAKKIHSFFFYIGYILFIIRLIIFIIFNFMAFEFMWDL